MSDTTASAGAGTPKYLRVAAALRARIRGGELKPGARLPAETALATEWRVSLPVIRQALSILRSEGLIESRQGVGTFVREARRLQRKSRRRYGRARADKKLLTRDLRHEILFAGRAPAPGHVAERLGISPGDEVVVRRRRLHSLTDDRPEELGASWLSVEVAGGTYLEKPTVVPKALFLCVEELSGLRYAHATDYWVARQPSMDEVELLELPAATPVLHVIHTARADDGTVLEVSESVWPADRIAVIDEYPIDDEPDADDPSEV